MHGEAWVETKALPAFRFGLGWRHPAEESGNPFRKKFRAKVTKKSGSSIHEESADHQVCVLCRGIGLDPAVMKCNPENHAQNTIQAADGKKVTIGVLGFSQKLLGALYNRGVVGGDSVEH